MKYSIIINPNSNKSKAMKHALGFIQAILKQNRHEVHVFLYGIAVQTAFDSENKWRFFSGNNLSLVACSTLAEPFLDQSLNPIDSVTLGGLGQWMNAVFDADKHIEFK